MWLNNNPQHMKNLENRESCWCCWGRSKYQTAKSQNSVWMPQTILKGHHISDTVSLTLIQKYVPLCENRGTNCALTEIVNENIYRNSQLPYIL